MTIFRVRDLEHASEATFEAPSVGYAASEFAARHATLADIADGTMEVVVYDGDKAYSVTVECEISWTAFVNGLHKEDEETGDE